MKPIVQSYRDLIAWQKAMELVAEVYRLSQTFPPEELYGLTNQIRGAAVAIPSNIAQGQGKSSSGQFKLFLGHARGSLFELETQILIIRQLDYINAEEATKIIGLAGEVGRLLNGLINSLKKLGCLYKHLPF